jgi:hypothetical protein
VPVAFGDKGMGMNRTSSHSSSSGRFL